MMKKYKAPLLLTILLMLAAVLTPMAQPALAQGRSVFGWVVADRVSVQGSSGLSVVSDAAIGDDLAVSGDLDVGAKANLTPATVITVTMNATITPLGAYQPLASSGTVNTSSIAVGAAGDVLTLVNTTNTSIVFTDTGTLKLTGNLTLGQYDSVTLISDGTNLIQLATSNN